VKILVIGANGKIGRLFCRKAAEQGLAVRAMLRDPAQRSFFEPLGVETVLGDLEGEFGDGFEGCDRVVFTAGSGGHTGGDKTLLVDLYGAIRAIEESERRGIQHFVMVSALRAGRPLEGPPAIRHYLVAKKLADERLRASGVSYTILRPGHLSDEPASGRVRSDPAAGRGREISRENVALCVLASLRQPRARRHSIDLLDGEQPIEDLFATLSTTGA
jgi:uncharacterized protein YbjT (DUF2867 family)